MSQDVQPISDEELEEWEQLVRTNKSRSLIARIHADAALIRQQRELLGRARHTLQAAAMEILAVDIAPDKLLGREIGALLTTIRTLGIEAKGPKEGERE